MIHLHRRPYFVGQLNRKPYNGYIKHLENKAVTATMSVSHEDYISSCMEDLRYYSTWREDTIVCVSLEFNM